ncbi:hypothetical protein CRYUN_Cryun20dG0052200 [Craigia yunnanensis]
MIFNQDTGAELGIEFIGKYSKHYNGTKISDYCKVYCLIALTISSEHRALVLFIELSAEMYKNGVADNIEATYCLQWHSFYGFLWTGHGWGFTLASVFGLFCPPAEIPLLKFFNLWYHPQANVEIFGQGLVTWTSHLLFCLHAVPRLFITLATINHQCC